MPPPDLSRMKALIADDRAEARDLIAAALRGIGVTSIESIAAGLAGTRLVSVIAEVDGEPPRQDAAGPDALAPVDLVKRFTHDIASPLACLVAISELAVLQARSAGGAVPEDLQTIHTAVREVATRVHTLAVEIAASSADDARGRVMKTKDSSPDRS